VLPYFESLEFSLVGMALGVSENAARKRVDRALEKLRAVLQKRGLTTTSAVLAGALAESSAAMAPLHLGRRNHRRGADSILGTLHGLARPGSFSTDLASL
jgi:hypothetical protein